MDKTINAPIPTRGDYAKALELLLNREILLDAMQNPSSSFLRIFEAKLGQVFAKNPDLAEKIQGYLDPVVLLAHALGPEQGVLTSWTVGVIFGYVLRDVALIREMNEAIKQ